MPTIVQRSYPKHCFDALREQGYSPLLARIYAARNIARKEQLAHELRALATPLLLKNAEQMACLLADAIAARKRIVIIADYDADGATACAVAMRALRRFGALVDYLVPNRFRYGYGLTPEIVELAARKNPDLLLTVDNGIASVEGVAAAKRHGIEVLITDHHLPGDALPDALCIVNPNQPGCEFPSKNLAGVGVIFYMMVALRAELRRRGAFIGGEPNLANLLDLVALGTVADVVKLDDNNRILVHQGLARIRAGRAHAGIAALLEVARRDWRKAGCFDLGFMLGPRLNAAGRLADMSLGIECLITDDRSRALEMATELDALNRERREIEAGMQESALAALEAIEFHDSFSVSLFDRDWHQGVIGIVASRIKDKLHRPTFAFARAAEGRDQLKGSGRSIAGLHLRDALDLLAKRHPGLLHKFGGHAATAGLTLLESDFARFRNAFEEIARALLTAVDLERVIETDGNLHDDDINRESALTLSQQIWGRGFPRPAFSDRFIVESQRVAADKHLRARLRRSTPGAPSTAVSSKVLTATTPNDVSLDAMLFFSSGPLPDVIDAVYRLDINDYDGGQRWQLIIEHWQDASAAVAGVSV